MRLARIAYNANPDKALRQAEADAIDALYEAGYRLSSRPLGDVKFDKKRELWKASVSVTGRLA